MYKNRNFWYENIPPGNPGAQSGIALKLNDFPSTAASD
jgi:hypothetical protein